MESLLLVPVVIALATLCAALFAVAVGWYREPDTPNARQEVEGAGNLVGLVVAVAAFLVLGIGDAVVRAVPGTTFPSLDRTFLGVFVAFAASVPVLVGPGVTRRTMVDGKPLGDALLENLKRGALLGLLAPLGVVALIAVAKSPLPPAVALVPPVLAFAYSAGRAVVAGTQRTRVAPSAAPTDAVERAIGRTGFDSDRVIFLDSDGEDLWRPFGLGIGPFARVFVPLSSFEAYDDDVLETLLVIITQKSPFRYYRLLTGWGAVGVAFALLFGGEFVSTTVLGVGFLGLLVGFPVAVWGGRRIVFRNDARVVATVGADRVVDAFVAQDEQRGGDSPSPLALLLGMTPSTEERVEHLGGDPSRLPSSDVGQDPTPGQGGQPPGVSPQAPQRGSQPRGQGQGRRPPGGAQPAGGRPPSEPPAEQRGGRRRGGRHGAAESRDVQERQPREGAPPREPRDGEQRRAPGRDPQRRESPPPEGRESDPPRGSSWDRREDHSRRRAPGDDDRDDAQW
jgi:hypothetical protein